MCQTCDMVPGVGQIQVHGDQHAQAIIAEEQVVPAGHDPTLPGGLPSAEQQKAPPVYEAPCVRNGYLIAASKPFSEPRSHSYTENTPDSFTAALRSHDHHGGGRVVIYH